MDEEGGDFVVSALLLVELIQSYYLIRAAKKTGESDV